ncbi:MAG: PAS domain-containing sensor histidine kinase [Candidatus Helarchaeota archaeon]
MEDKLKALERELKEIKEYYKELIESIPEIIFETDRNLNLKTVNSVFFEKLGYTEEDLACGLNLTDLFSKSILKEIIENHKKIFDGKLMEPQTYLLKRKNQEDFWGIINAQAIIKNENIVGIRGIITDINDRIRYEKELKKSEEKYRGLYNSLKEGVVMYDTNGYILECNQTFLNMLDYSIDEIQKLRYKDLTPRKWNKIEDTIFKEQILEHGYSKEYEKELIKKDGTIVPITIRLWLIKDQFNKVIGVWGLVRDISNQKQMEKELKKTRETLIKKEKLASIGLLAGGIAHEINNPIMGIINYAEIIKSELENLNSIDINKKPFSFITGIINESNRIVRIIDELLVFSQKDSGNFVLVEISDEIKKCINIESKKIESSQIEIKLEFQKNLPKIPIRPQGFQQVILNILENSIYALNEKFGDSEKGVKNILIKTSLIKNENVPKLKILIQDNGQGIKSKDLKKIFTPFFTTKFHSDVYSKIKGTGLGLSISYTIIQQHGGDIHIQSKWKEGTTVEILLPVKNNYLEKNLIT